MQLSKFKQYLTYQLYLAVIEVVSVPVINVIALTLFVSRMETVCDEMGVVLQRTAFSPIIKDRLDFFCALFDKYRLLCAQATNIPVHLGSMAFAMADIVGKFNWAEGDVLALNYFFLGGTHLSFRGIYFFLSLNFLRTHLKSSRMRPLNTSQI